jgi:ribosomal protein S18 acetylase RimI-like enzyme
MIRFQLAHFADALALARAAKRAFDSDVDYGASGPGGPPGYDDPVTHMQWMNGCDYYKIEMDGQIVGAVMAHPCGDGRYEMCGLFIDPDFHRQGIGRAAMQFIESAYPAAKRWTLGTPAWNTRTPRFYESLGYASTGHDEHGGIRYEKTVSQRD